MLRLSRLELSGFKTFVDPVGLDFAGGITAIVGPNGCGKSNLSDAITWVLGEQSAKSLRGESMEDVIFNGTDTRRPLGMAEVTLELATDSGHPGSQDGKITIGRRVFRSGESQYRLNGKSVRLKDVRDLLMDTGLGLRAYSVIEQGKIGMILSGKPQERRRLIEEAAGITRYKSRKQVAEVKLEEATANLLRLEDVVGEVERSLRSLKRQAAQARRFEEQQAEYRGLLRAVLLARGRGLAARHRELAREVAAAVDGEAAVVAAITSLEADLAAARTALDEAVRGLQARGAEQAELAAMIEGRQEFLRGARQTLQDIAARMAAGQALAERRSRDLEAGRDRRTALALRREELVAELEREEVGVEAESAALAAVEREFAAGNARLDAQRAELLASLGELSRRRNELHRHEIESEKAALKLRQTDDELAARRSELSAAQGEQATAERRIVELAENLEAQSDAIAGESEALDAVRGAERLASDAIRASEDALAVLRQRRELLAELDRSDEERRGDLLAALAADGIAPDFLAARLHAPARWARSLDLFLGELADAVVLPAQADSLDLARRLAHAQTAAHLVRPRGAAEPAPAASELPQDPELVGALAEVLAVPAELASVLPPAYLVASAAAAERLARRHPGIAFVAPDEIWAEGGIVHVQAEAARPGVLARDAELGELAGRESDLLGELEQRRQQLARVQEERRRGELRLRELEAEAGRLRQEQAVATARRNDLGKVVARIAAEVERLEHFRGQLAADLDRLKGVTGALRAALAEHDALHQRREADFDGMQATAEEVRSRREALRTAAAARRGQLVLVQERLRGLDGEAQRLERELQAAAEQLTTWEAEARELQRRQTELDLQVARAQQELDDALARRAASHEDLRREQEAVEARRAAIRTSDDELQARRTEREDCRQAAERLRLDQARLVQDEEHLAATFEAEFQASLAEALAQAGPAAESAVAAGMAPTGESDGSAPVAAADSDLASLEAQLAECKAALERIGPVNVLAAQEYAEQEERLGFLTTQRADVRESVERLRTTIREINQTTSERFKEAFALVNTHFGEIFTSLFRGGEAEMRLLDEDDLLETGIEIIARPPGKRPQNLMLLSGGEKALTAIALLFALFRLKPSPFCILDEVDAPLDDVNTLRFVDLLTKMGGETQFLVVTHNKLTMEVATRLYGVTMEERGVSKLVAVTLDEVAVPPARAASA
jgi:chromosome segregation protein